MTTPITDTNHHDWRKPMSRTIINPPDLHDPTAFGYSHVNTAEGSPLVFIAGQYDSGDQGMPTSSDFDTQVRRAFDNLGKALRAAGFDYDNVVKLGTFIVDHDADKLTTVGKLVHEHWGDRPPAQTLNGVARLALPEMLFEVDAIAIRF